MLSSIATKLLRIDPEKLANTLAALIASLSLLPEFSARRASNSALRICCRPGVSPTMAMSAARFTWSKGAQATSIPFLPTVAL